METGFFLRDTPQGYRDYECPDLPIDRSIQDTLQKFFVPIEMLLGLLNDDSIKQIFATVQVLVNSIIALVAATEDYQGSEFCSGLHFGMHGSNMLLSVAKTFTMKIETILEEVNKFTSANTVDKKYISAESKQKK